MGLDGGAIDALISRIDSLLTARPRVIIGIAGAPGAGKSTIASTLLEHTHIPAVVVPFDGFHLASAELNRLGRAGRKGALDTFDLAGYRALLHRLAAPGSDTVYAPRFDRSLEEPIAGAIAIPSDIRLIITEGNYLLVPEAGIERHLFDEIWYLELDDEIRRERLIARHIQFGKTHAPASTWAHGQDENNARIIRCSRDHADVVVRLY